jgi:hypothetical protein
MQSHECYQLVFRLKAGRIAPFGGCFLHFTLISGRLILSNLNLLEIV